MPENGSSLKPDQILDIAIKNRWSIIIPFCLAMLAGMFFAITLPKIYQSSTLILVQPQRVPENYVQSLVSLDIGDRINNMSRQILSRTNLERIINDMKLFQGSEYEKMFMEDMVADLRKRIEVEVIADRQRQTDAFTISFKGKDPEKVMNVVNTLASYFIEENLRMREKEVIGTSVFLEDELSTMRIRLEKVEESLKEYRKTYMGELPEQLDSNLRILDRLQEQLGERQQSLSEAKIHLASLQSLSRENANSNTMFADSTNHDQATVNQALGLERLREQLNEMKTRYTERHPDIIRLKEQIAELEAARSADSQGLQAPNTDNGMSPEHRAELLEVTSEIDSLKSDISDIKGQIQIYKKRVENTPKREQELLSLRRDYQNIQTNYDSLLARKLESEIAVNMERKQKGEQFRVLDPARIATNPIEPDMRKLFLVFITLGLGIGAGIIFVRNFLSTSFKHPDEIEEELNLPVLGTIPCILRESTKRWQRIEIGLSICSTVLAVILLGSFATLSFVGVEPTLSFVGQFINI
ncbi:MAG: GNVR domain-containing protein [Desulfobacteraceae bacterium]|jgi:polysaccharide chain length determinant protein (PEP-CTERM system associated)